jgi:molecular chaperone DnaK
MGGTSGTNSGIGRGAPKPGGVAVALKLPCATLDEVKARHPELKSRSLFVSTSQPLAMDTVIRLKTQLSDGTACFRAAAVVERVQGPGGPPGSAPGMMLSLLRMDDAGRELVAWMGGKPPALLTDAAPAPAKAAAAPSSKPAPAGIKPPPAAPQAPARASAALDDLPPPDDWDAPPAAAAAPPSAPAAGDPWDLPSSAESWDAPTTAAILAAATPTGPQGADEIEVSWGAEADAEGTQAAQAAQAWLAPPVDAMPPSPAPAGTPASSPAPSAPAAPPAPPAAVAKVPAAAPAKLAPPRGSPPKPAGARPGGELPPAPPASRRPEERLPRPTLAPGASAPISAAPELPEHLESAVPVRRDGPAKGPIIGIDLGTTNSCAAVVRDGKPFIIPSREGYNTIPSVVAISDRGKLMVGHPAKGQLLINPRSTVYGAKRLIGRQFNSPVVSEMVGRFSYEIVAGQRGEAAVRLGNQVFSLQKISSLVLAEVKDLAQQWLGTEVSRAVVTVPAYYNDNQRQAVRAAGALAGLEVERILNEPTAAAIAFAHGRTLEQRVMVYDLGGGTFDTSVLQLSGNVYEVISTGGDTFLGGVDFDSALVGDLLARFKQKHGIDFPGDRVAYQRVVDAAERAKIALSERLTAQANVPFVALVGDKAYDLDTTVTRAELEKLTSGLIDRSLAVCAQVLASSGLKPEDIGDILIVGGQSRMPLVRAKLREFFGKEPSKAVHPDEAVALGAAVLAQSIQSEAIGGMVLVDVLPMSIGIGLPGGRFKKVVERNTSLPHKKTHSIWTSEDHQKTLEIAVFQGESAKVRDNEYLGTLVVPDLPPGTKGNVVFDIVFSVSAESILTVAAEERGTARSVSATFSTQDTPEAVRRRLSGGAEAGERPRPAAAAASAAKGGWMKRIFGGG